ncbi:MULTISPECIES: hypothetical protein [unclassified Microcoleus]|uniref:hypothetical protein n=1 Tax=unclassified Microcoleus TaxID=2642155 RepID=UPI001E0176FB|nr:MULTISPECIES: hypothetical protein [unclassified Microcoleus]MCC3473991.1 hypothetical protein [Microcoleus sp. PH2017_13_LAR_U_A]MCC3486073.1 hypothetical protein [Microcoleus sp. PH2017_14_LAR_D_A]MCC3598605.1 hypothetical protein [Microcoleus sp. PH2017_26_ELK_O_A]MCC3623913.1 hypothetical protein [Microcoleus sp. PH2017_36_ELK_O_B]
MGLYRAFVQSATTNNFPNTSAVTEAALTTTASVVLANRPALNRRGFAIENDGTVPMIFAYGATVTAAARSIRLEPGDYFEDTFNWQGAISAMSVSGSGTANITELTIV